MLSIYMMKLRHKQQRWFLFLFGRIAPSPVYVRPSKHTQFLYCTYTVSQKKFPPLNSYIYKLFYQNVVLIAEYHVVIVDC